MTDEMMDERRRLFLEEMARLKECAEHPTPRDRGRLQEQEAPKGPPARLSTASPQPPAPRPKLLQLFSLIACLALACPILSYARRQAEAQVAERQSQEQAVFGTHEDQGGEMWRRERVQRAQAFFEMPEITDVQRGQDGLFLFLQPRLSRAEVIALAWRMRRVLAAHGSQVAPRHPWRINVCSGTVPCSVAVSHVPSDLWDDAWHVIVNGKSLD